MELTETDRRLITVMQDGLPLVAQPYAAVARVARITEEEAIQRIEELQAAGIIKRFGVVVRHRRLGYRANAMVVWDVPDADVSEVGRQMAEESSVTLCYRRPRRPPEWPYNLFCMIHGHERDAVEAEVERIVARHGLDGIPRAVLFSRRCFKQCGAAYGRPPRQEEPGWTRQTEAS